MRTPGKRQISTRHGYAMLAVLVFLAVGLILVGVNQRQIASLLRLEQSRLRQRDFDEAPVSVMGAALKLFETGMPPSDPYTCGLTVNTSAGTRSFSVTFSSLGANQWSVQVAPVPDLTGLTPMPETFAQ